jgi:hypothetical protein
VTAAAASRGGKVEANETLPRTRPKTAGRSLASLIVTGLVLAWSIKELASLLLVHTTGPEIYGVMVAFLAVVSGVLSVVLVWTARSAWRWAVWAVVALWAIVAIGGMAGTLAHVIGPVAGHGPVDLRPRPVAAPLIFTVLGFIGAGALLNGQRVRGARLRAPQETPS